MPPNDDFLLIAEIGQAHDGSLGNAHAAIDAIANAGASAVKFQVHIAAAESTAREPWRVKFSKQDESRYAYWQRMEFTPQQWAGLRAHATERHLSFIVSPFSVDAVRMMESIGVAAWKVAAGELDNAPLLEAMAATRRPIHVSTGMCAWDDIDRVVAWTTPRDLDLTLYQCMTAYTCPPTQLGLNVVDRMETRESHAAFPDGIDWVTPCPQGPASPQDLP
jgi:N-acetylneuraminate synthase